MADFRIQLLWLLITGTILHKMKPSYIELFKEEALELLAELEEALIALEENPSLGEPIDRVFRALHTLKGSGAVTGFEQTSTLAHEVESIFELVRTGDLEVSSELINLTLSAHDLLKTSLDAELNKAKLDPHLKEVLLDQLYTLAQDAINKQPVPLDVKRGEESPPVLGPLASFLVRFRPHASFFQRGIQPSLIFCSLAEIGTCLIVGHHHEIPPLEEIDPEECHTYWDLLVVTGQGLNAIRDVFIMVEDDCDLSFHLLSGDLPLHCEISSAGFRSLLTQNVNSSSEDLVRLLEGYHPSRTLGKEFPAIQEISEGLRVAKGEAGSGGSLRVKSERLDNLVNLIGELVTIQARLGQAVTGRKDTVLTALTEEIERLTWELRDEVLFIRMLPIDATFNRIKRMVRDLTQELGKEVELIVEGTETELDKTVIEKLQDPLIHLLRNAIDHGIEPPNERVSAGKSERGTIRISASHSGPKVVISVADDGRGLNLDAILRRAKDQGLVENHQHLSDREIYQLIFAPGFSTAHQITSISGRGVGMDVVRRAIEGLRGTIDVSSTSNCGTTFTISLPLTLAIIDGLLVNVGSDQFVLPHSAVEECIELTKLEVERNHGRHLVMLRNELIPYIRLRDFFGCRGDIPKIEQIVITSHDGARIGLVVDKVIGSHQTVIKSIGGTLQEISGFSGATILGDGRVALILDIPGIIGEYTVQTHLAIAQ